MLSSTDLPEARRLWGGGHDTPLCHDGGRKIRQCFARQLVKVIFVLSPGYASLPKPLQFVKATVVPAIWSDISNAIQGFKDHSTARIVLDEGLGLEFSNFDRLLKMRPGKGDEHRLVQRLANNVWLRQTGYFRTKCGFGEEKRHLN